MRAQIVADKKKTKKDIGSSCSGNHACDHSNTRNSARNNDSREETSGIFGFACSHYHAINVVDMFDGGEKFAYPNACLVKILEKCKVSTIVGYDLACSLSKNHQKQQREIFQKYITGYAIGSLHAYGHKSDCHYQFGPFWVPKTGYCKFEMTEWLWSRFQGFIGSLQHVSFCIINSR